MSYTFDQMTIGQEAKRSRTVTETDVVLYGGISGDLNPAHFNEEESKKGMFGGRIVHGMLTAGYISAVLGMQLPGPGTIYLKQSLKFTAPVRFGDTITATVTVIELDEKRKRATLKTECSNQNGDLVLKGEAVVIPPAQ
ncbi:MaoC family dehydratase [Gottschalkiaceae bacterium SANA]|jgi:3-hydroxybutyryl-CoA dehydratase|nr:MaoC family dehydratase [Gottschalkiaceae bacterium SANA]